MSATLIACLALAQSVIAASLFHDGRIGLAIFWCGVVLSNIGLYLEAR